MNKLSKILLTLSIVGAATLTSGLTAHAAELNTTTAQAVFDATYYAEQNPDVVAALGNDATALLSHYVTCGATEGRNASAEFNVDAYAAANDDLKAAFGDDVNAYINHYVTLGKTENRISTTDAATNAGITVTSLTNPDVVIAKPAPAPSVSAPAVSGGGATVDTTYIPYTDVTAEANAIWDSWNASVSIDNWTGEGFFIE